MSAAGIAMSHLVLDGSSTRLATSSLRCRLLGELFQVAQAPHLQIHPGIKNCSSAASREWYGGAAGQAAQRAATGAAFEGPHTGRRRFWHFNHGCRIASTPVTDFHHFLRKAEARCNGTTAQKLTEVASDGAGLVA